MMILAIETSGQSGSIALLGEQIVDMVTLSAGKKHSDDLLPMIHTLLTRSQIDPSQLTGIAFGQGPGSFTGLRIACGLTQGMAFGLQVPVVAVGTLEAMAEKTHAHCGAESVIAALDARMNEIYLAAYRRIGDAQWVSVVDPILTSTQQLPDLPEGSWTACGSGLSVDNQALSTQYGITEMYPAIEADAMAIAQLSRPRFSSGDTIDPRDAQPIYLRNKVALKTCERESR